MIKENIIGVQDSILFFNDIIKLKIPSNSEGIFYM